MIDTFESTVQLRPEAVFFHGGRSARQRDGLHRTPGEAYRLSARGGCGIRASSQAMRVAVDLPNGPHVVFLPWRGGLTGGSALVALNHRLTDAEKPHARAGA